MPNLLLKITALSPSLISKSRLLILSQFIPKNNLIIALQFIRKPQLLIINKFNITLK